MLDKNKHLHQKHAEELLKLSDGLDNLNMNNEPYKSIVDNTLDHEAERDERDNYYRMENGNILEKLDKFYYKVASNMFTKFDNRSKSNNKNRISSSSIVKSSQKSIVTILDDRSKLISEEVFNIADLNESDENTKFYFVNQDNENCYSIPLEYIVCEHSDRKIVVYAGNRKLKEIEQRNDKQHAYEFGWAYNLNSEGNKQINKIILAFLNNIFKDEKDTIIDLLSQPNTMVLMILNRESTLSDKISQTNIVSLVMFGDVDLIGTCIDYVATAIPYTGMNFAPFLIHNVQVFGSKTIQRKSRDSIKDNVTTHLLCKNSLSFYYERLGFTSNSVQDYLKESEWQPIIKRMHVNELLKQNPDSTEYKIMCINKVCHRFVNYITYPLETEESVLYPVNEDDERSQWSDLSLSTELSKAFSHEVKTLIKERTYFEFTHQYKDMFILGNRNERSFFEKVYKLAFVLPIGKLYTNGMKIVITKLSSKRVIDTLNSQVFEEALKPLQITLFPEDSASDNIDKMHCWTMIKCACCKKHVYVKKDRSEYFNEFMTKTVMSVWSVHIFGLENIPNNEWYDCNLHWNICSQRKGAMFNKLKMSYHKDSLKEESIKTTAMMRSMQNLDGLWEAIYLNLPLLFNAIVKMCYLSINKTSLDEDRRTVGKDYAERSKELLECIAPPKRRTEEEQKKDDLRKQQNATRQKRKRENQNKTERHSAEKKWKVNYHNDLSLQLKFRDIEYVDVKSCKQLRNVSVKYIKELREEHQELLKKSKRFRQGNADTPLKENHFLMIDLTTQTPHVVDEEWFVDENESTGEKIRLVSEETINQCMNQPNKKLSLSTSDKRNIARYVKNLKNSSQIIKLKRVTTKDKDKEEEVKKYKNHISTSKISFIGYDIKTNYHRISDDWVEMNFKEQSPEVYKRIMTLGTGMSYTIPAGSSYDSQILQLIKKNKIELIGPKISRPQEDNLSCLPCSLASAFDYLKMEDFAERIMRSYKKFHLQYPTTNYLIQDLLDITKHNTGRTTHEEKMKFEIKKVKKPDVNQLLTDHDIKVLYHCVLFNNHAIVLSDEWIFDPTLKNAVPKDEKHLRFCAQCGEYEDTNALMFYAYKYAWK